MLRELHADGRLDLMARSLSRVDVDRFFGIEVGEFPACIVRTAPWMMDHLMNQRLSAGFGQVFLRIPLRAAAIRHGDALAVD